MRCLNCNSEFGRGIDVCPNCRASLAPSAGDESGAGAKSWVSAATIIGGLAGYFCFQLLVPPPPYVLTPSELTNRALGAALAGGVGVLLAHAIHTVFRKAR